MKSLFLSNITIRYFETYFYNLIIIHTYIHIYILIIFNHNNLHYNNNNALIRTLNFRHINIH